MAKEPCSLDNTLRISSLHSYSGGGHRADIPTELDALFDWGPHCDLATEHDAPVGLWTTP